MAKLKRDERVCPFCAETIKASAIKCRFCQSDVTPVADPQADSTPPAAKNPPRTSSAGGAPTAKNAAAKKTPAKKTPAKKTAASKAATKVPAAVAVQSPKADRGPLPEGLAPLFKNLTLMLAVLVALAAAGVGTLWWRAEQGSLTSAPNGVLVGNDARTEALISAADLATRTLSYDYKTLANDMETARARMTPSFKKEYDSTMTQVRANTEKNKIVLQAVAVSSAIISATEHKARVLVFLNQTTTAGVGKDAKQQVNQNSLVITLIRGDGDWDISKLTALG